VEENAARKQEELAKSVQGVVALKYCVVKLNFTLHFTRAVTIDMLINALMR